MDRHWLVNDRLAVEVRALGAAVNRLVARTLAGDVDLVLGHELDSDRSASTCYLGALVGPVANRISGSRFRLDGRQHNLVVNDRGNTLHGGPAGFSAQPWVISRASRDAITLGLAWSDPSGGHPGELRATVEFHLAGSELSHTIQVATDRPTLASPCLHPYFNLAGSGTIEDHVLTVRASRVLFTDETGVPAGSPVDVAGTPFDLRHRTRLASVLDADHPQIRAVDGLDHAFILDPGDGPCAVLEDPSRGRRLEVWTDQPSLQVFTAPAWPMTSTGCTGRLIRTGEVSRWRHRATRTRRTGATSRPSASTRGTRSRRPPAGGSPPERQDPPAGEHDLSVGRLGACSSGRKPPRAARPGP